MNPIKILITGGAGFIGSSLADRLVQNPNYHVVIVDNLLTGTIDRIPKSPYKNCEFIRCDVNRYDEISPIMQTQRFDYVFHYAAVVGVQRTLNNPVAVLGDIQGIRNVLDLSRYTSVKRVFFASSSEVYGESVSYPQHEYTTPLNSRLPYAVVKNVGESYLRSYQKEYGLNFTIFRFFNTYGEKQSQDFVISKFLRAALESRDITIYGDGRQRRTFCYIDDNVDACINAFENNLFVNEVINIGSDKEVSINELASDIISLTNSDSNIVFIDPLEEGDMKRRQPELTNMRQLLHRQPTPLLKGIAKILDSYSKRGIVKV